MNRLEPLLPYMTNSPDANAQKVFNALAQPAVISGKGNKYYLFVYHPKTRGIQYDKYPLVQLIGTHKFGFTAYNYHWGEARQYRSSANLYRLNDEEFQTAQGIPLAKFLHS